MLEAKLENLSFLSLQPSSSEHMFVSFKLDNLSKIFEFNSKLKFKDLDYSFLESSPHRSIFQAKIVSRAIWIDGNRIGPDNHIFLLEDFMIIAPSLERRPLVKVAPNEVTNF
ncbi:MAG: hypothetical protein MHPSP_004666, partial [Paramarteilia canceri]